MEEQAHSLNVIFITEVFSNVYWNIRYESMGGSRLLKGTGQIEEKR